MCRDKSEWLFSPDINLICWRDYLCGAAPLCTSSTQMRDERMGIALQLFSMLPEGARTFVHSVCGLSIARALFPNALVVIFLPVAAELCML